MPWTSSTLNYVVDDVPNISVVTKIEVLGFKGTCPTLRPVSGFYEYAVVLDLPPEVVQATIKLRKNYRTKLPNAIIAATALTHNFTLITRNTRDFVQIQNLQLITPYEL